MANVELKATARPGAGKGAARAVRREGKVPGVIYGEKKDAQIIALDAQELGLLIGKGRFLTSIIEVNVDGQKTRAIPRDVQVDPVKDFPIHVDFQRVGTSSRIRVAVPCKFINEGASPGLKRGGVLNVVRHDIEVYCHPDKIPAAFNFDLTGLEIGRSIHISAIKLPEGVETVIRGRDFTVATVAGAKAEEVEESTTAVVADGAAPAAGAEGAAAGDGKAAAPAAGGKAAPAAAGAKPAAGGKAAPAAAAKPAGKPAAKK